MGDLREKLDQWGWAADEDAKECARFEFARETVQETNAQHAEIQALKRRVDGLEKTVRELNARANGE